MSKQKRPKQRAHNASGGWSAADVQGVIHNPVYAGVGPFPAIISDGEWIAVQAKQIERNGAAGTLRHIREALLTTFGDVPTWMVGQEWVDLAAQQCKAEGSAAYFARFLRELRAEYHE